MYKRQHYSIPCYKIQYFLFRLFAKLLPEKQFPLKYKEKATSNQYDIISFVIGKRYKKDISTNPFLQGLLGFYQSNSTRELYIKKLPKDLKIYYGKDVRLFNQNILQNTLESFYVEFMKEMEQGFSSIVIECEEDESKVRDILKFLCIGHVKVKIKR